MSAPRHANVSAERYASLCGFGHARDSVSCTFQMQNMFQNKSKHKRESCNKTVPWLAEKAAAGLLGWRTFS